MAHLEAQLDDPELRRICTPDYEVGCKRICFSDDWYPALARPDVEVVTDPLVEITATGLRTAGGTHHDLDVLIYGTGFEASGFLQPMDVHGVAGASLQEQWKDGAQAYLGVTVAGFPNFFMLYGPNTNLGANSIIYMLESQIRYVGQALGILGTARSIDVRPEVETAFNDWVEGISARTTYRSGCHSWYTNASGRNTNNWPTFTFRYRRRLRRLDPADYVLEPAGG
jgi:cation diffusion facilitator CzcD-associated flavoprotein CzcO